MVLLAPAPFVSSGTISITTSTTAAPREGGLAVTLEVSNSGDEAASAVEPTVTFAGRQLTGDVRKSLEPGARMQTSFDVPWPHATPGQWPLVVRVGYTDARAYPFEALQVALVSVGASPSLVAIVDVSAGAVEKSGTLRAKVKSLSSAAIEADVHLDVPRGLEAIPPVRHISLPGWADAEVSIEITNRAAVVGSAYPVFVTLEYTDPSGHHAALGSVTARIEGARALSPLYAWGAAGTLLLAWAVVLALRHRRTRDVPT